MPTTPNMGLVLPTEGASDDIWGGILNTLFGVGGIDDHDHTTGKGVKIPSAALNIDASVSWASGGTNYAITDLAVLDFAAVTAASVSSYAGALFVNSSDGNNLYFRTISGTNVKITDGTTLNVSIVGGIGGDYSSVSALLDYDDATDTYRFRQETAASVRQYAKMANADIKLYEYIAAGGATVPTNAVTLKSPAALAASYSVTFPGAVPASTSVVTMSSSGEISVAARTVIRTIAGTAWKHDDGSVSRGGNGFIQLGSGGWGGPDATGPTSSLLWIPLNLSVGDSITGYELKYTKNSDNTHAFDVKLVVNDESGGTVLRTDSVSTNAPGNATLTVFSGTAIPTTVATGKGYHILIQYTSGANPSSDSFTQFQVTSATTV